LLGESDSLVIDWQRRIEQLVRDLLDCLPEAHTDGLFVASLR